jgi:hypothetical protein
LPRDVEALATHRYSNRIGAALASGSFKTDGMVRAVQHQPPPRSHCRLPTR